MSMYRRLHAPQVLRCSTTEDKALLLWARKVRPDGAALDWLDETPLGRALGDGVEDHKPRIVMAWGELNRLGDEGRAYQYDVWSNLHYGYVGRAAVKLGIIPALNRSAARRNASSTPRG